MNILLISLLPTTENFGIKYIHSYLLQNGHRSSVLFIPHHDEEVENPVINFINKNRPDLVGCGFMTYEAPFAAYIGGIIKRNFPDIFFLAGGIHPTINTEECLSYADAVCIGESEDTVLEIVNRLEVRGDVQSILNVAYRKNGQVCTNPLRPLIDDLDRLPFPGHFPEHSYVYHKRKIIPMDLRLFRIYTRYDGKSYNIITSRGCPFSCAYCCNSFLSKLYQTKKIRKRSPQNVIEELRSELKNFPDLVFINIHDDCFLAQAKEWHREFVKDYKRWINLPFIVRSTPLHLTEEKVNVLKDAGLAWVTMGLQSGSERINKNIFYRNVTNEKFLAATHIAKKYGVSGYYDVILDNPFEEEEDIIQTLRVLEKIPKPFQLQLFSLTFYKGTDIYRMVKEKMGEGADINVRNYFGYRLTFLNRLVRISPLIPSKWIEYFIRQRKNIFTKLQLHVLYFLIVIFIEPISYFYLMLKAFNYKFPLTFKIALPTFKTKIRERLINFDFNPS